MLHSMCHWNSPKSKHLGCRNCHQWLWSIQMWKIRTFPWWCSYILQKRYSSQQKFVKDSNSYCDSLILDIPQLNLVLIIIYRPPNCPEILFDQTMEPTSNFLRNLEYYNQRANTYLVVGDFNFPSLKDGKLSENKSSTASSEKKQANTLHNFASEFFLEQYITRPTRNQNILDPDLLKTAFVIPVHKGGSSS